MKDDCIENISKALNFYRREKAKQKKLKVREATQSTKSNELFKSPLATQSKLGKYNGLMTKQTLYNKLSYRQHNNIESLLSDKDATIKMLQRRLTRTSPSDTRYSIIKQQLEGLSKQIEELKQEKLDLSNKREQLLQYVTEHAGNVVPVDAVYHAMTGKIKPRPLISPKLIGEPVGSPEDTYNDEDGGEGVGDYSKGSLGGGADIKQQQDEAPEGAEATAPSALPLPEPEPEPESESEDYEIVPYETSPQPRTSAPKPTKRFPEKRSEATQSALPFEPEPETKGGIKYGNEPEIEPSNELPAPKIDIDAIDEILKENGLTQSDIESFDQMIKLNDPAIYQELEIYFPDNPEIIEEIEKYLPPKPVRLVNTPKARKGPPKIKEIEEPTRSQIRELIDDMKDSDWSQSDYPSDVIERDFELFEKYKDKIDKGLPLSRKQKAHFIILINKYRKASGMTHSEAEQITHSALTSKTKKEMTQEQRDKYNERRRQRYAERKADSYYGK